VAYGDGAARGGWWRPGIGWWRRRKGWWWPELVVFGEKWLENGKYKGRCGFFW